MADPNSIPFARPEEIDDDTLKILRDSAYAARRGDTPLATAEFLLTSIGPLLDELIERRTAQALIKKHLEENVVYLEDHRQESI